MKNTKTAGKTAKRLADKANGATKETKATGAVEVLAPNSADEAKAIVARTAGDWPKNVRGVLPVMLRLSTELLMGLDADGFANGDTCRRATYARYLEQAGIPANFGEVDFTFPEFADFRQFTEKDGTPSRKENGEPLCYPNYLKLYGETAKGFVDAARRSKKGRDLLAADIALKGISPDAWHSLIDAWAALRAKNNEWRDCECVPGVAILAETTLDAGGNQ